MFWSLPLREKRREEKRREEKRREEKRREEKRREDGVLTQRHTKRPMAWWLGSLMACSRVVRHCKREYGSCRRCRLWINRAQHSTRLESLCFQIQQIIATPAHTVVACPRGGSVAALWMWSKYCGHTIWSELKNSREQLGRSRFGSQWVLGCCICVVSSLWSLFHKYCLSLAKNR